MADYELSRLFASVQSLLGRYEQAKKERDETSLREVLPELEFTLAEIERLQTDEASNRSGSHSPNTLDRRIAGPDAPDRVSRPSWQSADAGESIEEETRAAGGIVLGAMTGATLWIMMVYVVTYL